MHCRQDFEALRGVAGHFRVEVDGRIVQRGRLPRLRLEPGSRERITLPLERPETLPGERATLTVSFTTTQESEWSPKGEEIAWDQFELPIAKKRRKKPASTASAPSIDAPGWQLAGEGSAPFAHGVPLASASPASPVLPAPRLTLWRSPIDNDGRTRAGAASRWDDWGFDQLACSARSTTPARTRRDGTIVLVQEERWIGNDAALPIDLRLRWTVDGPCLALDARVEVPRAFDDLARVGLHFRLPAGLEAVDWLGRGPHECYSDRAFGARFARHAATVDELFVPYVRPQSCGARIDTEWISLRDDAGRGLLFAGLGGATTTVTHLPDEALDGRRHLRDLRPEAETHLVIDAAQRGVGTGACGPDTLPRYRVRGGVHRIRATIVPIAPAVADPATLVRALRSR